VLKFWFWSILSLSAVLQSRTPEELRSATAIKRVQQLPANKFDPALSGQPFATWFKGVLGPGAELKWEVNDCGEQTGDPKLDAGRDIPTCVEADATNPHKSEIEIIVSINVGSVNKGANQKPQFGFASVKMGQRYFFAEQLHCLPKLLQANTGSDTDLQELRRVTGCTITEGKR
jgi:hypothetical protein